MLNRSATVRYPASPIRSRSAGSAQERAMARARAPGSAGGTSRPSTPSVMTSGMPPTADATTGRRRAMASRIEMPCASRSDGRTATARSAVMALTSSRRPVKTIRPATRRPRAAAWAFRASASEPSPTMTSQASGAASRIAGMASMRWRWPFSGSRRATTPISRASCGMPNSPRSPQPGRRRGEAREVDPVGDDGEPRAGASLGARPCGGCCRTERSGGPSTA